MFSRVFSIIRIISGQRLNFRNGADIRICGFFVLKSFVLLKLRSSSFEHVFYIAKVAVGTINILSAKPNYTKRLLLTYFKTKYVKGIKLDKS